MIIVVATLRVHPDKADVYEAVCRDLMPKVRASEPGMIFYELARSFDEPHTYTVFEVYRDADAMNRHAQSEHLEAAKTILSDCLIGPPLIRVYDALD